MFGLVSAVTCDSGSLLKAKTRSCGVCALGSDAMEQQPNTSLALQSQGEESAAFMAGAYKPIIEVAFRKDMWWSIPASMSQQLYDKHRAGEESIGYTWDWGGARRGAWSPDGEETSINRYLLDFRSMVQKNIDNHRVRSFRITWVLPEQIEAVWTGEIVSD